MASNPWLAGVNVSKCPVCDVRLLNGSCIDHGPPGAEEVEDWPKDPDELEESAESENPEEPQQQPEDKLEEKSEEKPEEKPEESQKKRRRKKTIVDTDSEDTPASSSADKQTEPPPKGDEASHV